MSQQQKDDALHKLTVARDLGNVLSVAQQQLFDQLTPKMAVNGDDAIRTMRSNCWMLYFLLLPRILYGSHITRHDCL